MHVTDRPCASPGLTSYRYRGTYGYIMIGATNYSDAKRQAELSTSGPINALRMEVWTGDKYLPV
jgi:hypothetical protein